MSNDTTARPRALVEGFISKETSFKARSTDGPRCRIRLRAERKVGQLLKEMAVRGERQSGGRPEKQSHDATVSEPTLSELGLSKGQSSRWQGLADIPQAQFEAALAAPTSR